MPPTRHPKRRAVRTQALDNGLLWAVTMMVVACCHVSVIGAITDRVADTDRTTSSSSSSLPPLPPTPSLPSPPPLLPRALARGAILQLWGHSQFMALTDHRVPAALKKEYGFDLVIAVPRSAHNSMCSAETHGQQCSATDMLTQEQFDDGVAAFAAANMSLVLYTSIMHVGHSPSWENGTVSKNHPEWSERDELGRCTADYGQCNLSPAGGGVAYAINYTLGLAKEYGSGLTAVMVDNAFWQTNPTTLSATDGRVGSPDSNHGRHRVDTASVPLPAGFEAVAVSAFRRFVDDWFGSNATSVLGVNASTIVPPNAAARAAVLSGSATPTEVARVGVWELWRSRAYAEAVEQFRTVLHPLGVSVLANTVFWVPYAATQWQYGADEELTHLDGVVSESHDSDAAAMALKEEDGRVLTVGRPQHNYIAVFNQSCQSKYTGAKCPLRPRSIVEGMVVASHMAMARPWLVAWALSPLIDAPSSSPEQNESSAALSALMRFRSDRYDLLFDYGASHGPMSRHARVGVLRPSVHNEASTVESTSSTEAVPDPMATGSRGLPVLSDTTDGVHVDTIGARRGDHSGDVNGVGRGGGRIRETSAPDAGGGRGIKNNGGTKATQSRELPSVQQVLRSNGVSYRAETELTILQYNSLEHDDRSGSIARTAAITSPVDLLVCENVAIVSAAASAAIVAWVREGGVLVATHSCATVDVVGRRYVEGSLLVEALGAHGEHAGHGSVVFVNDSVVSGSAAAMKRIKSMETISTPRDGKTDETTAWEATLWVPTDAADASTHPRLVIHFSNATSTGGSSVEGDLRLAVKLPPPLASVAASRLRATVYSPHESTPRTVVVSGKDGLAEVIVPDPQFYGVAVIDVAPAIRI